MWIIQGERTATMKLIRLVAVTAVLMIAGACGSNPPPAPRPTAPASPPQAASSDVPQRYAALRDTTVCVVDRTTTRGLRDLQAKRSADGGVVVLIDERIRPIEEVHPVNIIAGYAGEETWYTGNQAITFQGRPYLKYRGERRVPIEQLRELGEFQGIPLYAAPADTVRPQAVYVPVRVGCIFTPYFREDLYPR